MDFLRFWLFAALALCTFDFWSFYFWPFWLSVIRLIDIWLFVIWLFDFDYLSGYRNKHAQHPHHPPSVNLSTVARNQAQLHSLKAVAMELLASWYRIGAHFPPRQEPLLRRTRAPSSSHLTRRGNFRVRREDWRRLGDGVLGQKTAQPPIQISPWILAI